MRTVAEHQAAVRDLLGSLAAGTRAERLDLAVERMSTRPDDYRDRVLADDVHAPIDLPPFDNSQMDGYAVRSADLTGAAPDAPVRRRVTAAVAAGDPIGSLLPGMAAPIMTGAPIPGGADAVVPIEQSDPPRFFDDGPGSHGGSAGDSDVPRTVAFTDPVAAGTFVRAIGSDIRAGSVLLTAGTRLGPAQFGTLAASGVVVAPVVRRMSVLLLSTGHELTRPGEPLDSGHIYDANTTVLTAALHDAGARVHAVRVPDRPDELLAALAASEPGIDLVVTTGGVSAGAFEVVREALEPVGVRFESIAMQPGGPQGIGRVQMPATATRQAVSLPVVAFPGNPVSALVSFEMFLRPVLRRIAGLPASRAAALLPLAHAVDSVPAKHQVRRGVVNEAGMVELIGGSSSHLLHSYALSSLLVHLPVGVARVEAGDVVETWRIDV